jgi:hypothetical protein
MCETVLFSFQLESTSKLTHCYEQFGFRVKSRQVWVRSS